VAVNYNDDTWRHVEAKLQERITKNLSLLTNFETSYKDMLRAQGEISALKTILHLPTENQLLSATRRG
jgi:hypothetical protein